MLKQPVISPSSDPSTTFELLSGSVLSRVVCTPYAFAAAPWKRGEPTTGKSLVTSPKQSPKTFHSLQKSFRRAIASGFSLVEVTLALGISSFAVVSVFGCLSVGVNTLHDTNRDVTNAQIISEVSSMLTQTPFAQLPGFVTDTDTKPLYFDQAGRQLAATTPGGLAPTGTLYRATLSLVYPAAAGSTVAPPYPGAPSTLGSSANSVQISVTPVYGANAAASSQAVVIVPKS